MRLRRKLRRIRWNLSRLRARTTIRGRIPAVLAVVLVGCVAWATLSYPAWRTTGGALRPSGDRADRLSAVSAEWRSAVRSIWQPGARALAYWVQTGWEFATGRLHTTVEAESGKLLMRSVLASVGEAVVDVEPYAGWEQPLRAWAHVVTGYDWAEPRSFLEAEVGGFRRAVRASLDVVRLPQAGSTVSERPPGASATAGTTPEAAGSGPSGLVGAGFEPGSGTVESGSARTGAGATAGPDRVLSGAGSAGPAADGREAVGNDGRAAAGDFQAASTGVAQLLTALSRRDWGEGPRVLILHSHTSESYRRVPPDPRVDARHHVYNESDTGITRVGKALAERLQEVYGISTIHSTRIHNWPHHWEAYVNARETVEEILAAHPTIDIVLDLHRQGIENAVWATSVGGVDAVSIEVIYTTSQKLSYATHPNWKRNEAFAQVLARAMDEVHPGLLNRVTAVHDRRYNQDLHPHMLLLEVGNYLDLEEHAIAAARLLADAVALALSQVQSGAIEAMLAPAVIRLPQPPKPSPSSPRPAR